MGYCQRGMVSDFQDEFKNFMARMIGLSVEVFTTMYVSGLKPKTSEEVLLAKPLL